MRSETAARFSGEPVWLRKPHTIRRFAPHEKQSATRDFRLSGPTPASTLQPSYSCVLPICDKNWLLDFVSFSLSINNSMAAVGSSACNTRRNFHIC